MERETNPMQPMCRSGCGFYGNPATDGLCSVCYKDSLRKKQTPPVNTASVSVSSPQQTSQTFSPAITVTNTAQPTVQSLQINETKDKKNFSRLANMSDNNGQNKKRSWDKLNHNSKNKKLKLNSSSQNQLNDDNNDENSGNITTATDGESNDAKITISDESSKQQQPQIDTLQKKPMVSEAINAVIENELPVQKIPYQSYNKLNATKNMFKSIRLLPNIRKFPSEDSSNTSINTSDNASGSEGASTILGDDQEDKDGDKDNKKKKNRCAVCRKKVGLTGFECRCGGLFCAVHRYSDKHDCTFDYREHGAQEIRRNNPVVVGEKIQKI